MRDTTRITTSREKGVATNNETKWVVVEEVTSRGITEVACVVECVAECVAE